ncbi:methyltransferase domain-containing protein [Kribbella sp. NPDC004536]|uniref:methyltransferase domain-containing protein n=1 Tax=Kribbella sp. NPDC004536 TaxID=3364106 RepID=UPI00368F8421
MEDPAGFKAVDGAAADYFVRFLDTRRSVAGELYVKQVIKDLLDLGPGLDVLDVGSGTGDDLAELAAMLGPGGSATGLDLSSTMVTEARRRTAGSGLPIEFVEGDANELPFEPATFDRARAERVLMALPDPQRAVHELARVTRPGGMVVLSEMDAGTIFVNSSNRELTRALVDGFATELPTPDAGRNLQRLLMNAGLQDVRLVSTVIQNSVAFTRMLFADRIARLATEQEADAFWAELEQAEQEGWLCTGGTNFTAAGRATT